MDATSPPPRKLNACNPPDLPALPRGAGVAVPRGPQPPPHLRRGAPAPAGRRHSHTQVRAGCVGGGGRVCVGGGGRAQGVFVWVGVRVCFGGWWCSYQPKVNPMVEGEGGGQGVTGCAWLPGCLPQPAVPLSPPSPPLTAAYATCRLPPQSSPLFPNILALPLPSLLNDHECYPPLPACPSGCGRSWTTGVSSTSAPWTCPGSAEAEADPTDPTRWHRRVHARACVCLRLLV